jgi:hypothetical protein
MAGPNYAMEMDLPSLSQPSLGTPLVTYSAGMKVLQQVQPMLPPAVSAWPFAGVSTFVCV